MRPQIELRLFQCVVTLAEELSFTLAAKKLFLTQSALSRQIKELEDSLGVALFDRSTRKVTVTPAGIAFVEEARAALVHTERARQMARAVAQGQEASLSVGFSPHFNLDLFALIKKRTVSAFGNDGVIFTSSFTQEQVQKVCNGSWDAGLCFFPVEEPSVETRLLLAEQVGVVVQTDHPVARQERKVHLGELQNEGVILFSRRIHPGFSRDLEQFWDKIGYTPRIIQDVNTIAEALSLVAAGVGIAFVRYSLKKMLPPNLKMLDLPDEERLIVKMGMLYRKSARSSRLDKFIKLVTNLAGTGTGRKPVPKRA